MTVDSAALNVFSLFQICHNKLTVDEKAKLLTSLDIPSLEMGAEAFYRHVSTLKITTEHSEKMAIQKAVKSKIVSWYKREYNKMHPAASVETVYTSTYKPKEILGRGERVDKKMVPLLSPLQNDNWDAGITYFCMRLVSVGLASFGTFAAYFFYCTREKPTERFVVKLMADKENGGKKIVFVRN